MSAIIAPTEDYPYPLFNLTADKLQALNKSLMDMGMDYALGAKIIPIDQVAPDLHGMLNGSPVNAVDCSGEFEWEIYHATKATGEAYTLPEGSANEEDVLAHLDSVGFKRVTFEEASDPNGTHVYAGVLLANQSSSRIGHILLAYQGETMESHGSVGPDTRDLLNEDGMGFARKMIWFRIA